MVSYVLRILLAAAQLYGDTGPVCRRVCGRPGGFRTLWRHAACGLRWALEPPPREGACLWLALGTQAFPDERKNVAGAGGGGASARGRTSRARGAAAPRRRQHRGLGWALRACDGARADELSKDYRALRT